MFGSWLRRLGTCLRGRIVGFFLLLVTFVETLGGGTTKNNDHAAEGPCPICKAWQGRPGGSDHPKRPVFMLACEACGHLWKRMNWDGDGNTRCTAVTMFDSLRGWTERDTKTRNMQIEKDRFKVESINGLQFAV